MDPDNTLVSAINQDEMDNAPIAKFHQDLRADIAALEVLSRKLGEVRWPARVQPYVDAMRSTDLAASAQCDRVLLHASGYAQVQTDYAANSWCQEAQTVTNADTIRKLLRLPPVSN